MIRDVVGNAIDFARRPLHTAWVIAAVAGASTLLVTFVGIKVAELVEVSRGVDGSDPGAGFRIEIEARVATSDDAVRIESEGPPGTTVLLLRGGRLIGSVTLDEDGRATSEALDLADGEGPVQLVPLPVATLDLELPAPSPTPTPTPEPTATATPSPTPTIRPETRPSEPRIGPTPMVAH